MTIKKEIIMLAFLFVSTCVHVCVGGEGGGREVCVVYVYMVVCNCMCAPMWVHTCGDEKTALELLLDHPSYLFEAVSLHEPKLTGFSKAGSQPLPAILPSLHPAPQCWGGRHPWDQTRFVVWVLKSGLTSLGLCTKSFLKFHFIYFLLKTGYFLIQYTLFKVFSPFPPPSFSPPGYIPFQSLTRKEETSKR